MASAGRRVPWHQVGRNQGAAKHFGGEECVGPFPLKKDDQDQNVNNAEVEKPWPGILEGRNYGLFITESLEQ